jgi:rhomboid protease GluP
MFGGRKKLVMCKACRGLIEPSTRTCPLCGLESVPAQRASSVEKPGSEHFLSRLVLTINIALYVLMLMVDLKLETESALRWPSKGVFLDFGGQDTLAVASGEWWRLITSNFIHLGIIHIMFNSLALYQIGPLVEEVYGSQKFIFIYVVTGLFSSLCSYAFWIDGAGASGAIFGLIGLMAVYGYRLGGSAGRALMRQMLIWAAFAVIVTFNSANQVAHIGGLIAGAAMGFLIRGEHPATKREALGWNAAAICSALLVVVSFVMIAAHYGQNQRWMRMPQVQSLNRNGKIETARRGQYTPMHWNRISTSKSLESAHGAIDSPRQTTPNA